MMFFVLGMYLGSVSRIKISNPILIILTLALYTLSCVESYLLFYTFYQAGDAVTAVKASSFLYSFFLITLLFKNQNWIQSAILKKLGEMSFGIYLVHMFFLQAAIMVTSRLHPPLQVVTVLYQLLLVMAVLVGCSLCITFSRSLLTGKQNRWLGFN
jgi:peptidoglycan/LPS O-acetylase OafA/YrhL